MRKILTRLTLFLSLILTIGCVPASMQPTSIPVEPLSEESTATTEIATPTEVATPTTEVPTPTAPPDWPIHSLTAKLPDAPKQLHLYRQAFPVASPSQKDVDALAAQLKIPGKISTRPLEGEGGEDMLIVAGDDPVQMSLWSTKPFIFVVNIKNWTMLTKSIPADVRIKTAEAFLNERGLLTFPHIIEPPAMSRDAMSTVRVVPLIDEIPLYDYDPLNGRMLLSFDNQGDVSYLIWRPLEVTSEGMVDIVPAETAWQQFVSGNVPHNNAPGQCWQVTFFGTEEVDQGTTPLNEVACVNPGDENTRPYKAATISDVKLVYFAVDLSLHISPFSTPADSPTRLVFPMWQFAGTTEDGRQLLVLWPATPTD